MVVLEEFEEGLVAFVVIVLVVSLVFSVAGFTTVVLFSVFFSAGAGVTTVSFCSQAPKRPAQAKMQINFFIGLDGCPIGAKPESARDNYSALPSLTLVGRDARW